MRNLAGEKEADKYIKQELEEAGIRVLQGPKRGGEVPCSLTGKLRGWNLGRAWSYWVVNAPYGQGMPLDIATSLHFREYALEGDNQPKTYGQVVRVAGHCGCPEPKEWADIFDIGGIPLVVDPGGNQEQKFQGCLIRGEIKPNYEVPHFVRSLDNMVVRAFVSGYHIDTQEGLNEFARVVRSVSDARPL